MADHSLEVLPYCNWEYFTQASRYLRDYLASNPSFNGYGKTLVEENIKVFEADSFSTAITSWTLMGVDKRIPDDLWNGLLDLEPSGQSLERRVLSPLPRSSPDR